MLLDEAQIEYELRVVDILQGEQRAAEFLAINPGGLVPALITPTGETLTETAAILLYLAEQHGLDQLVPPPGAAERGRFLQQLFFQTNELQQAYKRWFYAHRYSTDGAAASGGISAAAHDELLEHWGLLEQRLRDAGPWLLGARCTLLDLHLSMWATYGLKTLSEVTDRYPAIGRVVKAVTKRPRSGPHLTQLRASLAAMRRSG